MVKAGQLIIMAGEAAIGTTANPFGYIDHAPFSGFGVDLVYGLREDGAHVHVGEVDSGLACRCACPACGRALVAKKGRKTANHFAHYGSGAGCGKGAETNAHIWAKEVLEREKRIFLPAVVGKVGRERLVQHKARMFQFKSAHLEKPLDDIVPDVILTTADGRRLLVEVLVTHACGPGKIAKLRERGLPAIEVDLGAWKKSSNKAAIEQALLEGAPRFWLFNEKTGVAEAKLRERIAQAAKQKEEEAAARARRVRRAVEARARALINVAARGTVPSVQLGAASLGHICRAGMEDILDPSIETIGFRVPEPLWQAEILFTWLEAPYAGRNNLPIIEVDEVMEGIKEAIYPAFHEAVSDDVREQIRVMAPDALLPGEAIREFLNSLCFRGFLVPDKGGASASRRRGPTRSSAAIGQNWKLTVGRKSSKP